VALDLPLVDEDGSPVALRQLIDKPTLLTLNYFRCAGICTPQLQEVMAVLEQTQAEPGRDYQVVTVSFDPRDTPAIARQKRINHLQRLHRPMPAQAWRFLTPGPAGTEALTGSVGFRYQPAGKEFIHPTAAIMLSPKGVVVRYLPSCQPGDLDQAVQLAARGEVKPPAANRLMTICCSYDPVGQRYVFRYARVAGLLLLVAALLVAFMLGRAKRRPPTGDT
jgi:protein SCO1/2